MRTRGGGGELRLMEMEGIGLRRMGGGAELGMEIIHRSNVLSRHTWAVHGGRIRAVLTKAEYTSEAQVRFSSRWTELFSGERERRSETEKYCIQPSVTHINHSKPISNSPSCFSSLCYRCPCRYLPGTTTNADRERRGRNIEQPSIFTAVLFLLHRDYDHGPRSPHPHYRHERRQHVEMNMERILKRLSCKTQYESVT